MGAPPTSLPLDLRTRLDAEPVGATLAYVAARLGHDQGESRLEVTLSAGVVRRVFLVRGPLGARELEEIGCREAPG